MAVDKAKYFDSKDLYVQAERLRQESDSSGGKLSFCADRAGLLVLDMQKYFLSAAEHAFIPSGEAILPGLVKLVEHFAAADRPIVLTRHVNTKADAGMMGRWWRDLVEPELDSGRVIDLLAIHAESDAAVLIEKSQYDAFYQTDLERYLCARGVEQIVVGGVMANLCCETTARSGFVRGFEVFFLVDGTAAYNREMHLATLRNIGFGFGELVTVAEISSAITKDGNA